MSDNNCTRVLCDDVIADFLLFQYISILELLCSVDMMSRNLPYRKYRPEVHVHKNAKTWSEDTVTYLSHPFLCPVFL